MVSLRRVAPIQALLLGCLSILSLLAPVHASTSSVRQLYTSSVAYCSPPIAILVNDLNLHFFPDNRSLEFDLTASSVQDNLNVSVALNINAYGLGVVDLNIDLCTLGNGILCPLPKYEFSGGGLFPLPDAISLQLPGIAFTIPDLEALATIQLTEISTGDVVGCVQVTLSNGNTARQSGVTWATVGLALLALFSSMLHSVIAQSVGAAQWRLIDVMMAIQLPAITSLLSINYPNVFIQYGLNFAWSIGLVEIPSLQSSISKTRANTGGHKTAIYGTNLTAQLATQLNPYSKNAVDRSSADSGSISSVNLGSLGLRSVVEKTVLQPISSYVNVHGPDSLVRRQQYAPNTGPNGQLLNSGTNTTIPVVTSRRSDNGGIAVFAERLYINPANAFLTVLTSIAILLAILIGALLVVLLIALIARSVFSRRRENGKISHQLYHWGHRVTTPSYFMGTVTLATLGRYLLITFPIFFIFAFYQWDYGDSWVGHLVAGIFTVVFLAFAAFFLLPMILHVRRGGEAKELYYNDTPPARAPALARQWGQMGHMFRPKYFWFTAVFLLYTIIRACFISFAQGHGTRQAIGLLVLELILFVTLCVLRVGRDKKSDFIFILLCFCRMACWAVCIVFLPIANIRTIPRVIVGFVLLVVTALPIIFLFFLTIHDLYTPFLKRNRRNVLTTAYGEDYEKTAEHPHRDEDEHTVETHTHTNEASHSIESGDGGVTPNIAQHQQTLSSPTHNPATTTTTTTTTT